MKKVMLAAMCALMFFGTITTAFAEHGGWRGGIRARIHESEVRVERGTARGSLTRREAHRLHEELNRILYRIDRMKDDGHLSERERNIINHDLDRLDRDISREKHNDRVR